LTRFQGSFAGFQRVPYELSAVVNYRTGALINRVKNPADQTISFRTQTNSTCNRIHTRPSTMPRAAKPKGAKGDTDSKPYPTTPPPTSSSAQQTPSSSPSKKPKGWTKADKIKLLLEVIGSQKADFELIKDKFEGRTKSQVSWGILDSGRLVSLSSARLFRCTINGGEWRGLGRFSYILMRTLWALSN